MTAQEYQTFRNMSCEDFLNLLKQGKEVWNNFKKTFPRNLPIIIHDFDFSNTDFSYFNFLGVNFNNCNFSNTRFYNSSLNTCVFNRVNFTNAHIGDSGCTDINFTDSKMQDVYLSGNFKGSVFRNVDLTAANIACDCINTDFFNANLYGATIKSTNFSQSKFQSSDLSKVKGGRNSFANTELVNTKFEEAYLPFSDFSGANLSNANFTNSFLSNCIFYQVNFSNAIISNSFLQRCVIVEGNVSGCVIINCFIYGLSAWGLKGVFKEQSGLVITPKNRGAQITVDNLDMAQFIFLLLDNKNIRNVIDTVTSKTVLILGRFTPERKEVLDTLRIELSKYNYVPVLFDFENSANQTLLETVITLAGMARFIIADITIATMVREELRTIIEKYPSKPIKPILLETEKSYVTFPEILNSFKSVLSIYSYKDKQDIILNIEKLINPIEDWLEQKKNLSYKTQREIELENQIQILKEELKGKI
jgi:uncharacterized protein YjbI with pentapeptide repeats